jgi:hypothetical protein
MPKVRRPEPEDDYDEDESSPKARKKPRRRPSGGGGESALKKFFSAVALLFALAAVLGGMGYLLVLAGMFDKPPRERAVAGLDKLRPGMTGDDVRKVLGPPTSTQGLKDALTVFKNSGVVKSLLDLSESSLFGSEGSAKATWDSPRGKDYEYGFLDSGLGGGQLSRKEVVIKFDASGSHEVTFGTPGDAEHLGVEVWEYAFGPKKGDPLNFFVLLKFKDGRLESALRGDLRPPEKARPLR